MYPFIRLAKEFAVVALRPKLSLEDTHVSYHICWPWDLDFAFELNNGRTLSIFDLGRIPYAYRVGLFQLMVKKKWRFTMAGSTIRYRRRVTAFQRLKMTSQVLGRDDKFIYIGQSMWRGDECTSSILHRTAMLDKNGLVDTQRISDAFGMPEWNPVMPDWVNEWIAQEKNRTWPPEF